MKVCTRCGIAKDETHFHKRAAAKDGLQAHCKLCEKEKHRSQYLQAKRKIITRTITRRNQLTQAYKDWKSLQKCARCGEQDEVCLDLHHLDPTEKEYSISVLARDSFGSEKWQRELDKCVILCSNCHRKVHKYGIDFLNAHVAER